MAGAPPVGRRIRTTRTTPSKYVRTTLLCGAHSSSRILVPPVGRWARTTQTTPFEYVRTTLFFGAHSSSRPLVASVHRQLVIDHSAVELPEPRPSYSFAPRSASMLHSTSPRVASTSLKIGHRLVPFFALQGSEACMHDTPRTSILESTLRMAFDGTSIHAIYRRTLCCRSHCTAAKPPTLLLPIHPIARPFTAPASTVTTPQL